MRASDHARERTVALLRRRCGEGYLSLETFERRIEDVYRARSTEQLAGLTADLPAIGLRARLRQWRLRPAAAAPDALRLPLELVRDRPLTLGRSHYCDVVLAHDTVSRRHAEIRRDGAGWYLRDLGSSNGTWLGGSRVEREQRVRRGDQLLLGGCLVVVV
jgi:FHA domain/Domain of unknown function (DUF1707)